MIWSQNLWFITINSVWEIFKSAKVTLDYSMILWLEKTLNKTSIILIISTWLVMICCVVYRNVSTYHI